nr:MAG TPA_asm: hypothetical protein [Caudoviricetes sp.]
MAARTCLCSLPKLSAIWRLDATGSPFWVDKMMSAIFFCPPFP